MGYCHCIILDVEGTVGLVPLTPHNKYAVETEASGRGQASPDDVLRIRYTTATPLQGWHPADHTLLSTIRITRADLIAEITIKFKPHLRMLTASQTGGGCAQLSHQHQTPPDSSHHRHPHTRSQKTQRANRRRTPRFSKVHSSFTRT
jgi:hypothetical protein